jgi:hypothetical protein
MFLYIRLCLLIVSVCKLHAFLAAALGEGEWSAPCSIRYTPDTHWIEGKVDIRAGVHAGKDKNLSLWVIELQS